MSVLLDGLMLLVFVLCVVSGWRRGFIKVLGGLLALIAATVVSSVVKPLVVPVIAKHATLPLPLVQLLCSIVLFLLVYAATGVLFRCLDVIAKLPLIKQLNRLLGLAAGIVSGVLWVLFAMGVVTALALLGWIPSLTPTVLEETQLISWLATIASAYW